MKAAILSIILGSSFIFLNPNVICLAQEPRGDINLQSLLISQTDSSSKPSKDVQPFLLVILLAGVVIPLFWFLSNKRKATERAKKLSDIVELSDRKFKTLEEMIYSYPMSEQQKIRLEMLYETLKLGKELIKEIDINQGISSEEYDRKLHHLDKIEKELEYWWTDDPNPENTTVQEGLINKVKMIPNEEQSKSSFDWIFRFLGRFVWHDQNQSVDLLREILDICQNNSKQYSDVLTQSNIVNDSLKKIESCLLEVLKSNEETKDLLHSQNRNDENKEKLLNDILENGKKLSTLFEQQKHRLNGVFSLIRTEETSNPEPSLSEWLNKQNSNLISQIEKFLEKRITLLNSEISRLKSEVKEEINLQRNNNNDVLLERLFQEQKESILLLIKEAIEDTTNQDLETENNGEDTTNQNSETKSNGEDTTNQNSETKSNGEDTTNQNSETKSNGEDTTNQNSETKDNENRTTQEHKQLQLSSFIQGFIDAYNKDPGSLIKTDKEQITRVAIFPDSETQLNNSQATVSKVLFEEGKKGRFCIIFDSDSQKHFLFPELSFRGIFKYHRVAMLVCFAIPKDLETDPDKAVLIRPPLVTQVNGKWQVSVLIKEHLGKYEINPLA